MTNNRLNMKCSFLSSLRFRRTDVVKMVLKSGDIHLLIIDTPRQRLLCIVFLRYKSRAKMNKLHICILYIKCRLVSKTYHNRTNKTNQNIWSRDRPWLYGEYMLPCRQWFLSWLFLFSVLSKLSPVKICNFILRYIIS